MNSTHGAGLFLLATLIFLTGLSPLAEAQNPSFRLKRSKKETVPINVQLMAGYNGMSDPAEIYQGRFENTNLTAIGGFAVGLQGMIELDTLVAQVWVGADVTYFRMYKRALYDDPTVRYVGEPDMPVDAIESLWGLGVNAFVAFGPVAQMTLLLGGGLQYHEAGIDKNLSLVGTLTENRIIPAGMVALNIILLEYDHGSIDAQFRGIKGFGEYGSIHLQSMLGFTFSF